MLITNLIIILGLVVLNIISLSKIEDLEDIITNLKNKDREYKQIIHSCTKRNEHENRRHYEKTEKIIGLLKYFTLAYAKEVGYTVIEPSSAGNLFSDPHIEIWGISVHGEVKASYMQALEFANDYHKYKLFKTEEEALVNVRQNVKHSKST